MVPRPLLIALFWTGCIAVGVLALLPATLPLPSTGWDKANHGLAFVVLAVLGARCWPGGRTQVLLALAVYGGAIEIAQSFTATRTGEFSDWLADAAGLAIAAILWARVRGGAPRAVT